MCLCACVRVRVRPCVYYTAPADRAGSMMCVARGAVRYVRARKTVAHTCAHACVCVCVIHINVSHTHARAMLIALCGVLDRNSCARASWLNTHTDGGD